MPSFEINIIKDTKDEFEIEFFQRFYRKVEGDNISILKNSDWIEEGKGMMHKEVKDKELAESLRTVLAKNGVDAYTNEEHRLKPGYRVHVNGKTAKKDFLAALNELEREWGSFKSELLKKIK